MAEFCRDSRLQQEVSVVSLEQCDLAKDILKILSTLRVYYSTGNDELKEVTGELQNDNSGKGRFQVGIFKKPTDPSAGDLAWLDSGYQEPDFEESQIYGGIYVEDSANNCITK